MLDDSAAVKSLPDEAPLGTESRLADAIGGNQLAIHYQPQIRAQNSQVLGFEALVRWESPEFGLVLPMRFLGVAENLGLLVDIGSFVLDSACRDARAWLDVGASDFTIAINVSAAELERAEFVASVQAALSRWSVPPSLIELELTEGMMTGDVSRVIRTMSELKELGVKLALDDFGTGYSSLSYLRKFPLDKLKIDRSFVEDISSDPRAAGICRAIITLGHQLGMTVLAEGVESAAQVGYLQRNACDEFQGFYFSPAVRAEEAFATLHHRYATEETASRGGTPTVLLVDDEENILRALTRTLRRDGYRILTASNVADGLDILARNDVQAIISDQRMPGGNGTEFLAKVKDLYPDTIRIILSGYSDLASVTEAINHGAIYKFLTKPWNDDELRVQMREVIRRYELGSSRRTDGAPPPAFS
ncbi:MAG TPA: EAL domain-containing protein [Rudaea sp.]|nr:EAL domain-containing protein [Rudaea sp.]